MKALVVVDYQIDYVNGALGFEGAEDLEPIIVEKINRAREDGGKIIFTMDTHDKNYLKTNEGRHLPVVHCVEGTKGHRLFGSLALCRRTEDIVIRKNTFGSPELLRVLWEGSFDEVELCGVPTDKCVLTNAVLAKTALPEARITVDSGACASPDREAHKSALRVMKSVQIEVL